MPRKSRKRLTLPKKRRCLEKDVPSDCSSHQNIVEIDNNIDVDNNITEVDSNIIVADPLILVKNIPFDLNQPSTSATANESNPQGLIKIGEAETRSKSFLAQDRAYAQYLEQEKMRKQLSRQKLGKKYQSEPINISAELHFARIGTQEVQQMCDLQSQNIDNIHNSESEESEQPSLHHRAEEVQEFSIAENQPTRPKRLQRSVEHTQIRRSAVNLKTTHLAATQAYSELLYLGPMDSLCNFCGALHFMQEKTLNKVYTRCCSRGEIVLPPLETYPNLLQSLLMKQHEYSNNFIMNIRKYNSALSFASIGVKIDFPAGRGPYCFRIHGQIYHKISNINDGSTSKRYGQLYFLDTVEALVHRTSSATGNDNCLPALLSTLDTLLREINPFAEAYRFMRELEEEEQQIAIIEDRAPSEVIMQLAEDRHTDPRRYNIPTANEVAVVFRSADGLPPSKRDIRIHLRGGSFMNIDILSPNCDPLSYTLLFPRGEPGWQPDICSEKRLQKGKKRIRVTLQQYYAYRLSVRTNVFNPILNAGKLTQQFIVDAYVKVEGDRLIYIRTNQSALRVERYQGLVDHLQNETISRDARLGKLVLLPSTFAGSPRAMRQHYQDAMAIVTKFGKPDLFVTFTCNPKWQEIQENLEPWQSAEFRPDLIARVFHLKLKELMKDIKDRHVLGMPLAVIHTIEFQKRGLPHAHILIFLRDEDKLREPDQIDSLVNAEFPDPTCEPRLYEIVCKFMVHGPCGTLNPSAVCMKEGKCSKRFPKPFQTETKPNVNGYPLYRRKDTGRFERIRNKDIDNRYVVPYNKWLLLKYNAHINVEVCSSVKSVKYICGYVHKGHDCATIRLETVTDGILNRDEVQTYVDSRYVSAPEAMWRLLGYKMHDQSHYIIRLAIHLPNQQNVYFQEGNEEVAAQNASLRNTTLTAWFKLNQTDPTARGYLYADIPRYYVYQKSNGTWTPRKRGDKLIISRMYSVSLRDEEKYYLRLLLLHVTGAENFEQIRTVNGVLYNTFKEAAEARNLLADDREWQRCLEEAVITQMPSQLRSLFAYICVFCEVSHPDKLWQMFKDHFIEDYASHHETDVAEQLALTDIQAILFRNGTCCNDKGLPTPPANIITDVDGMYDAADERVEGVHLKEKLNSHQLKAFDAVMLAINDSGIAGRYFFLDGPGGTGKTFVYNTLISVLRGEHESVLAVAWTGIAAMLLKGGRTVHSTFRLPVPIVETSTCDLREGRSHTERVKRAKLIIWDEVTLTPALALDAVDRALRDILRCDRPFGGKTVLLGGDFRQCLPVVRHGHRTQIVESCIKNSLVWKHFKLLRLSINMRANPEELEFCRYLQELGDGLLTNKHKLSSDLIPIPAHCVTDDVVRDLFGDMTSVNSIVDRAILCPKNDDCLRLNELILHQIPGQGKTYYSIDSISDEDFNRENFNMEFLNSLTPSGMPPHKLTLKPGAVVMLLRNLDITSGLCNGTRLIIKNLTGTYLDAEIAVGSFRGQRVFIPKIDLAPSDANLPFILKRRQFPVRLSYAMTINKAQGQTLDMVGIYLQKPVFGHGQLYVAFSRARSFASIKIEIKNTPEQGQLVKNCSSYFTRNVVYKEIL